MACPDEHTLGEMVAGVLAGKPLLEVERHLDECPACWQVVVVAAQDRNAATAHPVAQGPDDTPLEEQPLVPGRKVGRYEIEGVVGAGGMGIVYCARDPRLQRQVAIKLLRPAPDVGAEEAEAQRQHLLREGRALAVLAHPHVVKLYDVGRYGSRVFLAMELVHGKTLAEWLSVTPRSLAEIVSCLGAAGEGLAAAHDAGLVHRDFKPGNVIVGDDGRVRVTDFGLVRTAEMHEEVLAEPTAESSALALHTQTGALVGTPRYMAPEQHAGKRPDSKADQFAFCVCLYEAIFRQAPFPGLTTGELASAVLGGRLKPPPPESEVPRWLRRVVLRGLRTDPEQRYPSMRTLLRDLSRGDGAGRRRWIAAAALLALVAGTLLVVTNRSAEPAACLESARDLRAVWTSPNHSLPSHLPRLATGALTAAIDRYVGRWSEARARTCATATGAGAIAEAYRTLRCLDWRLTELRAIRLLLRRARPPRPVRLAHVVHGLTPPEECLAQGSAPMPEAVDDSGAEWVSAIRHLLARAKVSRLAGEARQSAEWSKVAVAAARRLSFKPLVAEALHSLAEHQAALGKGHAAEATARRASIAAEASRHDQQNVKSWLLVLEILSRRGSEAREIEGASALVDSALSRVGRPDHLEAQFAWLGAYQARQRGNVRQALRHLQRALGAQRKVHPWQPLLALKIMREVRRTAVPGSAETLAAQSRMLRRALYGSATPPGRQEASRLAGARKDSVERAGVSGP